MPEIEQCKHGLMAGTCTYCDKKALEARTLARRADARVESWAERLFTQTTGLDNRTLEFLLDRGRVTAQVPVHDREGAERRYRKLTGDELPEGCVYFGDQGKKWATSGHVRFGASDEELDGLDFNGYDVLEDGAEYVVNSTELFWQLVSIGMRLKEREGE